MGMEVEERFWYKVRLHPTDCWNWLGAKCSKKYGSFRLNGVMVGAHRLAYELTNGPIPEKHHVLHTCDNPTCVRPSHLVTGTNDDNVRDKVRKSRQSRLKGAKNPSAILNENQVRELRAKYVPKKYTYKMLAEEYGVHPSTIWFAVSGRHWPNV